VFVWNRVKRITHNTKNNNNDGTDGRTRVARTSYSANENPILCMGTSFAPSGHVVVFCAMKTPAAGADALGDAPSGWCVGQNSKNFVRRPPAAAGVPLLFASQNNGASLKKKHINTLNTKNSLKKGSVPVSKRLLCTFITLFILLILSSLSVSAGYCANPGESTYCSGAVDEEDCCPASADYYGEYGAPDDQSDCEDNFYSSTESGLGDLCSDVGCCYIDSEQTCSESSLQGTCEYDGGEDVIWDSDGCSAVTQCTEGCCLYMEGTTEYSIISSQGFCDVTVEGYYFNDEVTDDASCSDLAATYTEADIECADGADNDGDGLADYPLDTGCSSETDSSEKTTLYACDDDEDNDGDGDTDYPDDSGCYDAATASEELGDLDECSSGEVSTACNCYVTNPSDGTYCEEGNYCIDGVCQSSSDAVCIEGEREYCGVESDTGCLKYEICDSSGNWGICDVTSSCGLEPEVCDDSTDQDGDGLNNCDDLDCYETTCGESREDSGCLSEDGTSKGFYYSGSYVCCSTNNVNNCNPDDDDIYETCGSCACETTPIDPEIDAIEYTLGEAQLTISWSLACSVDFTLLRCTGESCPSDTSDMTDTEVAETFSPIAFIEDAWEYTDTTVGTNQYYCYVVEAVYPDGTSTYSEPSCIEDSGDAWCQQMTTSEFCLDAYDGMSEELLYRVGCTSENQVSYIENCHVDYGSDYMCIGPYSNGETSCEYQSDCATCGDPLGIYAILDTTVLYNDDDDYDGDLCYTIPMCYYDYTLTTTDAFQECADVSSCYDYGSQSACAEQYNAEGYNNKCLQRDCDWIEFSSGDGISNGICKEKTADYARCDACNDAVKNGIFDACTATRCEEFGVEDATCYLSGLTNQCTDIGDFTCTAYEDSASCRGDYDVEVDVEGTNEIIVESQDTLGLGLCYWNGEKCYKDANGDEDQDDGQEDMTPPSTIVLTADKMSAINITLLATDQNEDGSAGSGVKATYYCLSEDGSFCHPETLVELSSEGIGLVEIGDGSGTYALYYYAEDYSENLEVVQEYSFEVDKQAPTILIDYYVSVDTSEPYDESALTFDVSVDEEAYCTDSFETGENGFEEEYNDHFVSKFEDLSDGYYLYAVTCTDSLGNTGDAFVLARVDADTSIFDSSPEFYVDEASITLEVKTLQSAECGFTENVEEESFEDMEEGFEVESADGYYLHTREWTLTDNGLYFFDVKCELDDGTEADDEISFVYDDTAPATAVVDSFGTEFDFAAFYTGEELDMYLSCTDDPEYGFGCDVTYYCLDTEECDPTELYDPTDSIEYDLSDVSRLNLCYYSTEATYIYMGGLTEDVSCTEIKVDSYDPELIITSPSDGESVFVPYVTVTGSVEDADASEGTAINTVTITVKQTDGTEVTYTDDASDGFSTTVDLSLEANESTYNYITVYGTDRSGATTEEETVRVRYTTELGEAAIWIEEPANGVSEETDFDFVIGTYLEAEICGYSKNDASLNKSIALEAVASDTSGEYLYSAPYSVDESKDGIEEYVYVKCLLINGVEYAERLILEYDSTKPVIEDIEIINSDGKDPPSVVESPLNVQLLVTTDDRTKCKYSFDSGDGFSTGMDKFTGYDDAEYTTENSDTIEDVEDLTSYTLYVACQNGAYMTSETEHLSFSIDSSAASGIYLISPEVSGNRTFTINIGTTRSASSCTYGTSADAISTAMTAVSEKQYKTGSVTVSADGNYTYYFTCWFVDGEKTDYFTFPVDTTAPVIDFIEDGDVSYSNTSLSATWSASDSLTEIVQYIYSIGSKATYNDTFTWTYTDNETALIDGLALKNQSTYYWNVKAQNEVGLWSSTSSSNGIFIDASGSGTDDDLNASTVGDIDYHVCANGVKDSDETDVDCGGSCDACKAGSVCKVSADCVSINCENGICAEATCTDSIINQGESDVDCGGNYCDACSEGLSCVYHRDCASGYCTSKICTAASCDDGVKNGDETGTDCGGSCDTCEDAVLQTSPATSKETADEKGWSIWTWILVILLLIGAGVGGYYGYVYYMKKKGKLPPSFTPFSSLGKALPSLGALKKLPQRIQMPSVQKPSLQKILQQKQQTRDKIFGAFEERPRGALGEKLPEKRPVPEKATIAKTVSEKETKEKIPEKKEAPKKLGEGLVIKKPVKKEPSKSFSALDKLIKERKK